MKEGEGLEDAARLAGEGGLTLVGRSSSSFSRIARIFALELGVKYRFQVVPSLLSLDAADYGGNPALKLPSLQTPEGTWFGSMNVCRVLARYSPLQRQLVWPEALEHPVAANAQELTLVAMSTEVALVMSTLGLPAQDGSAVAPQVAKLQKSLVDTLVWLDEHLPSALAALPTPRDLSYLEVALYCLVSHLEFRSVVPVEAYTALGAFCRRFAQRPSVEQTPYRFDAPASTPGG